MIRFFLPPYKFFHIWKILFHDTHWKPCYWIEMLFLAGLRSTQTMSGHFVRMSADNSKFVQLDNFGIGIDMDDFELHASGIFAEPELSRFNIYVLRTTQQTDWLNIHELQISSRFRLPTSTGGQCTSWFCRAQSPFGSQWYWRSAIGFCRPFRSMRFWTRTNEI